MGAHESFRSLPCFHLYLYLSFHFCNLRVVMNLDGCDRLFFVAAFSNISSRENPSGALWFVFSLHFLPSFLFDIECLPLRTASSHDPVEEVESCEAFMPWCEFSHYIFCNSIFSRLM